MSGSLNKVELIGHLGKDPDIRTMQSGAKVANFSIATSESWKDNSGEKKERTQWHNIVVWNEGVVGIVERFLKKGDRVFVEGQLETRKWTDNSGVEKYATEIVLRFNAKIILLTPQAGQRDNSGPAPEQRRETKPAQQAAKNQSFDALDDEIPF